jgi:hypothetical protein
MLHQLNGLTQAVADRGYAPQGSGAILSISILAKPRFGATHPGS